MPLKSKLFRFLFEQASLGIAVEDLDGKVLLANPALCSLLGYGEDELRGMSCSEFADGEDSEDDWAMFQKLRAGIIDRYSLEKRYLRKDGSGIWGRLNVALVKNGDGDYPVVIAMVEDITERKRTEEALSRSETNYRLFVSQSSEGIFCEEFDRPIPVDLPEDELVQHILRDAYMAECNGALAHMYGIASPDVFIGKRLTETLDPENPANIELTRQFIRSGYRVLERESQEVDAEGNPKVFLNSMIGIVENGMLLRTWGIQRDVTDRTRAEEARRRAEEALRESEQRLRLAAHAGKMYAYEWDISSGVVVRSDECTSVLGLTEPRALNRQQILARVHPEDRARFSASATQVTPENPSSQFSYRLLQPDGSTLWLEKSARAFFDEQGKMVRVIGMVADVTERKVAEQELALTTDRLRLAMESSKSVGWDLDVRSSRLSWFGDLKSMFGIPADTFTGVGDDFYRSVHPEDREFVAKAVADAQRSRQRYAAEFRVVWPDGTVRWVAAKGKWYYGPSGEPQRMIGLGSDVTDLKQTEEALRESEERFRLAARAGKMFAYEWDAVKDVVLRSGECADILEVDETVPITGEQVMAKVHPDDRERLLSAVAGLTPEQPHLHLSYRIVRSDGLVKWVERSSRAHFDERGKLLRIVGMVADITDRKQAEEALRQREQELTEAQRLARMGSWQWDVATDTVIWSEELYLLAGRDLGLPAVTYKDHGQLYTDESWERLQRAVEEALRTGVPYELDIEMVRSDGSTLWLTARGEARRDAAGRVVQLRGTVQDITERKRAESAIRKSEKKFSQIFQVSPALMGVSKTDDGPFIDVNEAFEQVTGYTRDEVIGRTPIELGIYVDEPRHLEIVQRLKADGRVRDEEFLFKTKSGETRTGLLSLEPTDIGGETCVLGVISDVTERKQAEEAISSVSRRLIEAQEQERARIARDLHDDINQQLALLVIQFEQLKNDLPSSAKGLPSRIDQLKTQASQIAADVQAISHELHPPKLDYLGIAAAMKSFCAEFAGQQKVEVGFSQEDVPRSVPPEISLCLFRVLQEGLHNAVKHSGARHFQVSLRGSAHEIELLVHDSGRGFDPIVPANNVGLGLISMQERLQLVKGTFLIDSQPNHGTTIRARVPLRSEEGSLQATA